MERCKVLTNGRHPILMLSSKSTLPKGPLDVFVDGHPMKAWVMKIAINVLSAPDGKGPNQMGAVLTQWFGADAGKPGHKEFVEFVETDGAWTMRAVR